MENQKIKIQEVLTCFEDDNIKFISTKLKEKGERRIFVVDKETNLIGVITTTDLVYKALCSDNSGESLLAKDVMTTGVRSVDINEDINNALEVMNDLKTFVCPLTDNKKLLGIINYQDLIEHLLLSMKKE